MYESAPVAHHRYARRFTRKSRRPFEFGVKVSVPLTDYQSQIIGAHGFPGEAHDGRTSRPTRATTVSPHNFFDASNPDISTVELSHRSDDPVVEA
jgi:IS5 family transposase